MAAFPPPARSRGILQHGHQIVDVGDPDRDERDTRTEDDDDEHPGEALQNPPVVAAERSDAADEEIDESCQEDHRHTGEWVGPKMFTSASPAFRVKLHR